MGICWSAAPEPVPTATVYRQPEKPQYVQPMPYPQPYPQQQQAYPQEKLYVQQQQTYPPQQQFYPQQQQFYGQNPQYIQQPYYPPQQQGISTGTAIVGGMLMGAVLNDMMDDPF